MIRIECRRYIGLIEYKQNTSPKRKIDNILLLCYTLFIECSVFFCQKLIPYSTFLEGKMKYIIRKVPERNTKYLERLIPQHLIFNDVNHNGCIWSFLKAIELVDDNAIYVQDDILLCSDFVKKSTRVVNEHPDKVIVFSTPFLKSAFVKGETKAGGDSIIDKEGVYLAKEACWLLCTYIPKKIAQDFYNFFITDEVKTLGAYNKYMKMQADDLMFRRFLERYGYDGVFVTVPNLAGHEENKSVTIASRPIRICPMFDYENAEKKLEDEK